jgi:hypothetical protein
MKTERVSRLTAQKREAKQLGRDPFWWECDALDALDEDAA